jgi:hypothetical protein
MHVLLLVLTYSLYARVPGIQGIDRGPRSHLGRGYEPTGWANSSVPHSIILNFLLGSRHAGPQEVPELEVWERPLSTLRTIDGGPPGGAEAGGPGAPTINAKKHRQRSLGRSGSAHHQRLETSMVGPREVPELEVRERSPSTLRNVDSGPPGGPGSPTINTKKHRRWAPGR